MATPIEKYFSVPRSTGCTGGTGTTQLPLELILETAEKLGDPEDIVNYALTQREFLDYWIHLSGPQGGDPRLPPTVPVPAPATLARFQAYSENTMRRLFSPGIQRLLLTILMMPNPCNAMWDIEYRLANRTQFLRADPFPELFSRKVEKFDRYYTNAATNQNVLYSFQNLNRISPMCTAVLNFSNDFTRKALSLNPSLAHHSPPPFAHESVYIDDVQSNIAVHARNMSPIRGTVDLDPVERERLLRAFYRFQALCDTSCKITGYWEIIHALDLDNKTRQFAEDTLALMQGRAANAVRPARIADYNRWRTAQSPLAGLSSCEIEGVFTIYQYLRLQWLLILAALFEEYRLGLEHHAALASDPSQTARYAGRDHTGWNYGKVIPPEIFQDGLAQLEWVDVLLSKGIVFLSETLKMDADSRRRLLCQTYCPSQYRVRRIRTRDFLFRGVFRQLAQQPGRQVFKDPARSFDDNDVEADTEAWVVYNIDNRVTPHVVRPLDFLRERANPIRRRGYVFFKMDRLRHYSLSNFVRMSALETSPQENPRWRDANGYPDSPESLGRTRTETEYNRRPVAYPEYVWEAVNAFFYTPDEPPALINFGLLGETWRIYEAVNPDATPAYAYWN
ncbi:Uu.00g004350.m01.CDS01 [Anthostomella pinea]|uniref:Uu.00g004350.m01.CDS01 n=1 Tax=Anthostomella pinea TaxID=933095 RepID=A0AAI8VJX1_9PEZI|nr:Uu.00g004350.m01.CDS01 [Anthostomella pinea]